MKFGQELSRQEVQEHVEKKSPRSDTNFTHDPLFSIERSDVCAVVHRVDNSGSIRYDILFIVWKNEFGQIYSIKLKDTEKTNESIFIDFVKLENANCLRLEYTVTSSRGGKKYQEVLRFSLKGSRPRVIQSVPDPVPEYA